MFSEYSTIHRLYFFLSCFIILKIKELALRLFEKKMICDVVEIFLGQVVHLMLTQPACTSCVVPILKKTLHFSVEILY